MSDESIPESQPASESPEPSEQSAAPERETSAPPAEIATEPTAASAEPPAEEPTEPQENFADILKQFERSHTHKPASGVKQIEGTIVSLSAEQAFVDIGYKTEGVLPRSAFPG